MMGKQYFDFTGQVAVITGGSVGLGLQMAKALAKQGADIALLATREGVLRDAAESVRALGVKCLPVVCNVTNVEQIQAAVAQVIAEYGKVDILINNAGVGGSAPAEEMSDEMWNRVIDIDLSGVFRTAREFGKEMIKNKYGRVINIASMYGLVGNNLRPTSQYHAAKGGVVNLTRALAAEWAKYGITVNGICPGYFSTAIAANVKASEAYRIMTTHFIPMGRWGEEGELDTTVLYLASPCSSYITGTNIVVDGGYTCI